MLLTLSGNFGLVVVEVSECGKRVITTDGAPVWGEGLDVRGQELGVRGIVFFVFDRINKIYGIGLVFVI